DWLREQKHDVIYVVESSPAITDEESSNKIRLVKEVLKKVAYPLFSSSQNTKCSCIFPDRQTISFPHFVFCFFACISHLASIR
ncbi:hypothetical protein KJ830_09280, partial [bacterium]|nr:hypothetical protein [bacterium]